MSAGVGPDEHPEDAAYREFLEEHRCPTCDGDGEVIEDYVVTRDMAIDAGEPGMAGQVWSERIRCPAGCSGGFLACDRTECRCNHRAPDRENP